MDILLFQLFSSKHLLDFLFELFPELLGVLLQQLGIVLFTVLNLGALPTEVLYMRITLDFQFFNVGHLLLNYGRILNYYVLFAFNFRYQFLPFFLALVDQFIDVHICEVRFL